MVFPSNDRRVLLVNHFRCRFVLRDDAAKLGDSDIPSLLRAIGDQHRWMHVEKRQEFGGEPGQQVAGLALVWSRVKERLEWKSRRQRGEIEGAEYLGGRSGRRCV